MERGDVLLAVSVIANVALVIGFLLYLRERDERDARERQIWATRVQAPEMAPMLAPTTEQVDESRGYREEDEVLSVLGRDQ